MDFTFPETAEAVRSLARDITARHATAERIAGLEDDGAPIDEVLWRALGEAGLLGLQLPSALAGDAGGDLAMVDGVVVAEELGAALARVPFGQHAIAAGPVLAAHGAEPFGELIAEVAAGRRVVTVAIEEDLAGAGPEVRAAEEPETAVTATADGWSLTGSKVNVGYAGVADRLLVTAAGPDGPCVVVVAADAPGVSVTPTPSTGLTPVAGVVFDGTPLPPGAVLAGGAGTVSELVRRATLATCADQAGAAGKALRLTAEYAREREQFGRAIGSFQAVAQRLADGYIDVQALELTTVQAAWLFDRSAGAADDHDAVTAVDTAKFWACEAGHRVAHTAVHVHGGVGLDTSHPIHRYFLRAKQNEFTLASAPVVLRAIGSTLAATPA